MKIYKITEASAYLGNSVLAPGTQKWYNIISIIWKT